MKSIQILIAAMLLALGLSAQNSYTLIDTEGKEIYKNNNCEAVYGLFEGHAVVLARKPGGLGIQGALVNTSTGEYTVPFSAGYREIIPVMGGTTLAYSNEGLDYNGKPVPKGQPVDYPFIALLDAKTGRAIIPLSAGYTNISRIIDGKYHLARKANEFCVYDATGKKLFCQQGKYPTYMNDGIFKYVMVEYDASSDYYRNLERDQIINANGKAILSKNHSYTSIGPFHEGLAKVTKDIDGKNMDGFIDIYGDLVIGCKYQYASDFKHGYSIAKLDGKKIMISPREEELLFGDMLLYSLNSGHVLIRENGMKGLVGADGEIILEPKYSDIGNFDKGLAWVKDADGIVSIVNEKGMVLLPLGRGLEFGKLGGEALSFYMDGKWGLIGVKGKELLSPEFDNIEYGLNGHWIVKRKDKQGLYSEKDGWVVDAVYDEIYFETSLGKGEDRQGNVSYKLKKGDLLGLYYKGNIIEPKYSHIGVPNDGVVPVVK